MKTDNKTNEVVKMKTNKSFFSGIPHTWVCSKCGNKTKRNRAPTMKECELYIRSCPKCRKEEDLGEKEK